MANHVPAAARTGSNPCHNGDATQLGEPTQPMRPLLAAPTAPASIRERCAPLDVGASCQLGLRPVPTGTSMATARPNARRRGVHLTRIGASVGSEIIEHYQQIREEERLLHGAGRLELLRIQEVLRRHLPPAPARVLDVGGATGIHAEWLVGDGYEVHVIDITARHVEEVRRRLSGRGVTAEVGDARRLSGSDACFDVVLLLGPLYHLVERDDRLAALTEAKRVAKPGGIVAAGAISRFASLFDGLSRGFLFDPEFREIVERDLREGQHRNPRNTPHWFTTAYFHRPEDLAAEVEQAGLKTRELIGLEGLAGFLPQPQERWEDTDAVETLLYSARAVEREPGLVGLSAHLLLVAEA